MTALGLPGEVRVVGDPVAVAAGAAQWLSERCQGDGAFRIAVAGGRTPRFLYEALASSTFRDHIDWRRWHLYFGDERAVAPQDRDSNFGLVRDSLLAKVPIPAGQVHRMEADRPDLDGAAAAYSHVVEAGCGRPPRLDVVLLGLGEDGHTASLFPRTPALDVTDAWATRGRAPVEPHDRITLTFPAINAAAAVAFLVTGAAKAHALRAVAGGSVPAARVRPQDGDLVWFLDTAAALSAG